MIFSNMKVSFDESIYAGKITKDEAEVDQSNLLKYIVELNEKLRPKTKEGKDTYESACALYEGQELTLNVSRSGIFPLRATQGKWVKILASKQILQRLPISLAQIKAGNTSKNLLNEIRQIIHSFYWAKEITKKYITIQWIQ